MPRVLIVVTLVLFGVLSAAALWRHGRPERPKWTGSLPLL